MKRIVAALIFATAFNFLSCATSSSTSSGGGGGDGSTSSTVPDTENPGEDEDSVVIGLPGFNQVGDAATVSLPADGILRFALRPPGAQEAAGSSVKDEEFILVAFNSTSGDSSFELTSPDNGELSTTSKLNFKPGTAEESANIAAKVLTKTHPVDEKATQIFHGMSEEEKTAWLLGLGNNGGGGPNFKNGDAPGDEFEFRFPIDDEIEGCEDESAIVRVVDDNVRIAVDRDIPFSNTDTSFLCSTAGTLCIGALTRFAALLNQNIFPLIEGIFGELSDIDGSNNVTFLITDNMNKIPDKDLDVQDSPATVPVHGLTLTTDLMPFSSKTNECSNEGEYVYLHTADPTGVFGDVVSLTRYADADLPAAAAFQLVNLVMFNNKVLLQETTAELPWIVNTLGLLAVDLAGFYTQSSFMEKLAVYLDLPAVSLTTFDIWHDNIALGFQYLFGTFLAHSQVDTVFEDENGDNIDDDLDFISTLVTSELTGTDNIEAAVEFNFEEGVETEFTAMFKFAALAIVASDTPMQQSNSGFPYYKAQNSTDFGSGIADASGSNRVGADGGSLDTDATANNFFVKLNGPNLIGGITFLFENVDLLSYVPGNDYFGHVKPLSYSFTKLGGLFEDVQNFEFSADNTNIQGFLIRDEDIDPAEPVFFSENVSGTLDTTPMVLGSSTLDYSAAVGDAPTTAGSARSRVITAVGKIDTPQFIAVQDVDTGEIDFQQVPDCDLYQLTIPNDPINMPDADDLAVWVEIQPSGPGGTTELLPMLALVTPDDIPDPAALTTNGTPQFRVVSQFAPNDTDTFTTEDIFDSNQNNTGIGGDDCSGFDDASPAPLFQTTLNWAVIINNLFFDLFVLNGDVTDPDYDLSTTPSTFFEPRHQQSLEFLCGSTAIVDDPPDNGDNVIGTDEIGDSSTFQTKILRYMAREISYDLDNQNLGDTPDGSDPLHEFNSTHVLSNDGTEDLLVLDIDSRDEPTFGELESLVKDIGNNMGGYSVPEMENSLIQTGNNSAACGTNTLVNTVNPLLTNDIPTDVAPTTSDEGNGGTEDYVGSMNFNPPGGGGVLSLNVGSSYTAVVCGRGNTEGDYALKFRKFDPSTRCSTTVFVDFAEE